MARWAAREPAWARVVPRAEKRMVGAGWMLVRSEGHAELSFSRCGVRFVEVVVVGRARRERVWIWIGGWERRVWRMWEPCGSWWLALSVWMVVVVVVVVLGWGCVYHETCAAD